MNSMSPFPRNIKQHETHSALTGQTGPQDASRADLDLDAIVVPASRPAAHLDHAITLARAADCWLVILCSQRLRSAEVTEFLAARSHHKAIVIDLPPGYSHPLLEFPGLLSVRNELPEACGYHVTDLSIKRNVGLVMARMLQWRRVFFLDDDIRDITYPDLQSTVNMLGSFSAAGLWVTKFPDNSIVCHANRMTEGAQDVFVSGAALAVDCDADIGFFPDIYNEDWLFFFDGASQGRLANSCLKATQLRYSPFANPQRAAWQEFGDVLAEGLYALLHQGLEVQDATSDYWTCFLEARRDFLETIITRSQSAPTEMRDDMLLAAVQQALKCSLTIKPDVCERYVRLWRQDLADWKRRVAEIPVMSSVEEALQNMGLAPTGSASSTDWILPRLTEVVALNVKAGAVAIPRSETMKKLPEHVGALRRSSATAEAEKRDTTPFPVLTEEISAARLAARANGGYGQVTVDEVGGRQRMLRLGTAMSRLVSTRLRRRGMAQSTPSGEPELPVSSEPAGPETNSAGVLQSACGGP